MQKNIQSAEILSREMKIKMEKIFHTQLSVMRIFEENPVGSFDDISFRALVY